MSCRGGRPRRRSDSASGRARAEARRAGRDRAYARAKHGALGRASQARALRPSSQREGRRQGCFSRPHHRLEDRHRSRVGAAVHPSRPDQPEHRRRRALSGLYPQQVRAQRIAAQRHAHRIHRGSGRSLDEDRARRRPRRPAAARQGRQARVHAHREWLGPERAVRAAGVGDQTRERRRISARRAMDFAIRRDHRVVSGSRQRVGHAAFASSGGRFGGRRRTVQVGAGQPHARLRPGDGSEPELHARAATGGVQRIGHLDERRHRRGAKCGRGEGSARRKDPRHAAQSGHARRPAARHVEGRRNGEGAGAGEVQSGIHRRAGRRNRHGQRQFRPQRSAHGAYLPDQGQTARQFAQRRVRHRQQGRGQGAAHVPDRRRQRERHAASALHERMVAPPVGLCGVPRRKGQALRTGRLVGKDSVFPAPDLSAEERHEIRRTGAAGTHRVRHSHSARSHADPHPGAARCTLDPGVFRWPRPRRQLRHRGVSDRNGRHHRGGNGDPADPAVRRNGGLQLQGRGEADVGQGSAACGVCRRGLSRRRRHGHLYRRVAGSGARRERRRHHARADAALSRHRTRPVAAAEGGRGRGAARGAVLQRVHHGGERGGDGSAAQPDHHRSGELALGVQRGDHARDRSRRDLASRQALPPLPRPCHLLRSERGLRQGRHLAQADLSALRRAAAQQSNSGEVLRYPGGRAAQGLCLFLRRQRLAGGPGRDAVDGRQRHRGFHAEDRHAGDHHQRGAAEQILRLSARLQDRLRQGAPASLLESGQAIAGCHLGHAVAVSAARRAAPALDHDGARRRAIRLRLAGHRPQPAH